MLSMRAVIMHGLNDETPGWNSTQEWQYTAYAELICRLQDKDSVRKLGINEM